MKNLDFSTTVTLMKQGCKLQRSGWNGTGMYVIYNPGSHGKAVKMEPNTLYARHGIKKIIITPHFDMYIGNTMVPGL